jgi:hypothetical protein
MRENLKKGREKKSQFLKDVRHLGGDCCISCFGRTPGVLLIDPCAFASKITVISIVVTYSVAIRYE